MLGEAAFGGLLVDRREVLAGFLHDLYDLVERDAVAAVGVEGVDAGVHGAGCSVGVTFDAWDLNQSAYRVACEA